MLLGPARPRPGRLQLELSLLVAWEAMAPTRLSCKPGPAAGAGGRGRKKTGWHFFSRRNTALGSHKAMATHTSTVVAPAQPRAQPTHQGIKSLARGDLSYGNVISQSHSDTVEYKRRVSNCFLTQRPGHRFCSQGLPASPPPQMSPHSLALHAAVPQSEQIDPCFLHTPILSKIRTWAHLRPNTD